MHVPLISTDSFTTFYVIFELSVPAHSNSGWLVFCVKHTTKSTTEMTVSDNLQKKIWLEACVHEAESA